MARTITGHLIGRAAAIEARDLADANYSAWLKQERQKLIERESALFTQARDLPGFDQFWESVPDFGKRQDRINMLQNFIRESNPAPAFNWKVASANTLRVYRAAISDFEHVTGVQIAQATAGAISQWHKSMTGRKLAPNTIRTRIAAVRILTHIDYPLPPKAHTATRILSADQIKAILVTVTNKADRLTLVKTLTRADRVFTSPEPATATQALTRLIKSYARKAGLESSQVSLRVWRESGRALAEYMTPAELAALLHVAPADNRPRVSWKRSKLHGLNRRMIKA